MIAALFVELGGAYYGDSEIDPWGAKYYSPSRIEIDRDAREYAGPWPVVAHPPCTRWCQLARVNEARYGHKVGEDGGAFAAALRAVRAWGGVLEHPGSSIAWTTFDLPRPTGGKWTREQGGPGWVTEVFQRNYGHPARKRTWLYWVGPGEPPDLDWSPPAAPEAWISADRPRAELGHVRQLSKREAKATPPAFRALLISLARLAIKDGAE